MSENPNYDITVSTPGLTYGETAEGRPFVLRAEEGAWQLTVGELHQQVHRLLFEVAHGAAAGPLAWAGPIVPGLTVDDILDRYLAGVVIAHE